MLPIFNLGELAQQPAINGITDKPDVVIPAVYVSEPIEKPSVVKPVKRIGNLFTPSIKDAIAGNISEKKAVDQVQENSQNDYQKWTEPFTSEQLSAKWMEFVEQLSDRPNLRSTLSTVPELAGATQLILKIGNSVQEEEVRLVKFDLLSWLRKELRNSEIELVTRIEKQETERTFYTDSEKMQLMIQKNPELFHLKQKFNLDFKD